MLAINNVQLQQLQDNQEFDSLPIFANAENKRLDAEVYKLLLIYQIHFNIF